jgi:hypothetical protein
MGEVRNTFKILADKPEGKRRRGKLGRRCEDVNPLKPKLV